MRDSADTRQTIGGLTCSIMMNFLNDYHPTKWLLAVYIEYSMIGIMLACYLITPETPWFYVRQGNKEAAMKSMKRIYGGVEGYDLEEEYGIIARTIEHEKALLLESRQQSWIQIFRGLNGVSYRSWRG